MSQALLDEIIRCEKELQYIRTKVEAEDYALADIEAWHLRARVFRLIETLNEQEGFWAASEIRMATARRLAERTGDAYMAQIYGSEAWERCASFLLKEGLTEAQAETVLRSKWMRWADDGRKKNSESFVTAFKRYYANNLGYLDNLLKEATAA